MNNEFELPVCGGENGATPLAGMCGPASLPWPDRKTAGGVSSDGASPALFSRGTRAPGEYLTGEGPYRLIKAPWEAIADGRAL